MSTDIHMNTMSGLLIPKPQPLSAQSLPGCEEKSLPVMGIAAALPLIGSSAHTGDPPIWNPARRMLTFMGLVCLTCTMIVVGIVLVAFYLSRQITSRNPSDILYTVPESHLQKIIEVNTKNAQIIERQINELSQLLETYYQRDTGNRSRSDEKVNPNCSRKNNFGYYSQYPCVAIVLRAPNVWSPSPFNIDNFPQEVPQLVRKVYDPNLIHLTCHTDTKNIGINYSPYSGFHVKYFGSERDTLPEPFVMLRFSNVPEHAKLHVTCFLWTENVKVSDKHPVPGHIAFTLISGLTF